MRLRTIKSGFRSNFLCAGSSALMLYVAHNHPEFWYYSLIAFVPFLWRLLQVNLRSAVCLATMIATAFVLATEGSHLLVSPGIACFKLLMYNIAFVIFALGVIRAKRRLGFDPLMIALLWFPIEYVLITYADVERVFSIPDAGLGAAVSFCRLFGFALGSFAIVLVNALILWLLKWVDQEAGAVNRTASKKTRAFDFPTNSVAFERGLNFLLGPRAPPVHAKSYHGICHGNMGQVVE